ncbi:MAG: recombinase family protein [Clostridia bacterium]|nr:recombinase family protein [Clostridia bacterium]MBR0414204.1 recombinase family protein [Clostridia bacterium]
MANEFVDDGYSGSNFDRPGFQKMLSEIEKHPEITLVITKDLSRLGRNMSESSYYAEQYFVEKGIRYLAINDGFDSEKVDIMTPFRLATNEVYIRDTSNKVRSVLKDKREKGEYCACPPFGYMKDPNKRGALVPDPETAPIVQFIFELAAKGQSARSIAIMLTDKGYITPLKYRVLYRDEFSDKGAERATDIWNHTTVKRILKNQTYLGHTILGKTKKMSFKSKKKVDLPQEEWAVTKNTHTPLVSEEQFDLAAKFMGMNTKRWHEFEPCRQSIFNGIIFCKNCGGALCSGGSVYKGEREKYWYLYCQNIPERSLHRCEHGARIKYADLYNIIKEELNALISLGDEEIQEIVNAALKASPKVYTSAKSAAKIEKKLGTIDAMMLKLYEDNVSGVIDDDRLQRMTEALGAQAKSLQEQLKSLNDQKQSKEKLQNAYSDFFALAKSFTQFDELTPEIVRTFIDRIEIGEKILEDGKQVASHHVKFQQEIKIYYRFIGDLTPKNIEYSDNMKVQN